MGVFLFWGASEADVTTTASGLKYEVISQGNGVQPENDDTVTVHMIGTFLDGSEFDNSYKRGQAPVFSLNQVIPGLREGIKLLRPGGKILLTIPPDLAYGDRDVGNIKAGSVLVYEVELISVGETTPRTASRGELTNGETDVEQEATPFSKLPGGTYLDAIYNGDYDRQDKLAREYLQEMNDGHGAAFSVMLTGVASLMTSDMNVRDLTVLEHVLSLYMDSYDTYGKACLTDGWFERRYKIKMPDIVEFDEYGMETSRIPGETTISIVRLNEEFTSACDDLCNSAGATSAVAAIGDLDSGKTYSLGDLMKTMMQVSRWTEPTCDSPAIKQFERNLLAMYEREKRVSPTRRNTARNALSRGMKR